MSKATFTKRLRKWFSKKNGVEVPEAEERKEKPCFFCNKPMNVADGQICNYHSECRKEAKAKKKFYGGQ